MIETVTPHVASQLFEPTLLSGSPESADAPVVSPCTPSNGLRSPGHTPSQPPFTDVSPGLPPLQPPFGESPGPSVATPKASASSSRQRAGPSHSLHRWLSPKVSAD